MRQVCVRLLGGMAFYTIETGKVCIGLFSCLSEMEVYCCQRSQRGKNGIFFLIIKMGELTIMEAFVFMERKRIGTFNLTFEIQKEEKQRLTKEKQKNKRTHGNSEE